MNKIRNENNIKQISSPSYQDISQIDVIVDEILLKNKDRLDKIRLEEIDVEKFSLKNKKVDTFYYLRKKSNKKRRNAIDSKKLSKIIISEARANLGEDPLEVLYKTKENSKNHRKFSILKNKKSIRFGKKNKKYDEKYSQKPPIINDDIDTEEFVEIVSDIERIDNKTQKYIDEDEKLIDKKIIETPKIDESYQDSIETKTAELAKKYKLFSKKKTSDSKKKDDEVYVTA